MTFAALVQQLTATYEALWAQTPAARPRCLDPVSASQKSKSEKELDRVLDHLPESGGVLEALDEQKNGDVARRARTIILRLLSDGQTGDHREFFNNCEQSGDALVRQARIFDPKVLEGEIRQALRNLWVFNSIQYYLGVPVELTRSGCAYSLLYPYTDNWLDGSDRTGEDKRRLLCWLTERLQGSALPSGNPPARKIALLLDMIEEQYPLQKYPDVFRSLQAIHRAQEESLRLYNNGIDVDDGSRLAITFRKGGTSVLADGYLVRGSLSTPQADALFGYGVLLQLIDDLRDLDEDVAAGYSSPFSRVMTEGSLEDITDRLLNFTAVIVTRMNRAATAGPAGLAELIQRSCTTLIQEAVAQYQSHYSGEYVRKAEESFPVHFASLARLRQRLRGSLRGNSATEAGEGLYGPVRKMQGPHRVGVVQ